MTFLHALVFLGLFLLLALGLVAAAMVWLSIRLKPRDDRGRALPSGRLPVSPYFAQGRNALDQAEAAVRAATTRGPAGQGVR